MTVVHTYFYFLGAFIRESPREYPKHVAKYTVCRVCLLSQCLKTWLDRLNIQTVYMHTTLRGFELFAEERVKTD